MKNRLLTFIVLAVAMVSMSHNAMAWGRRGHAISAYIAEKHLTEKAFTECRRYLQHTLPYYSVWQDQWRGCRGFEEICTAHVNYVNPDFTVRGKRDVTRDPVTRVVMITRELENGQYLNMPDSIVAMKLKLLIHMATDMHCPSHVGYPKEMKRDQQMPIRIGGRKVMRHGFWDAIPQTLHPSWNLDDFLEAYDVYSPKKIQKICKGDPTKWGIQNARKMLSTFDMWEVDEEFRRMDKERRQAIEDITAEQLVYGGYRLASILNHIFK